jgi:hypothetical protein
MKRHQLRPWQVLRGNLHAIKIEDNVVIATVAAHHTLRYLSGSYEANFLLEHFTEVNIGRSVSLLKTDTDLRILWRDELPKTEEPSPFWVWYCKKYGYSLDSIDKLNDLE